MSWLRQDGPGCGDKDLIATTGPLLVACDPGTGGCTGHSADGDVMWEASTGVRDYVVRGSAASGGGEWIWLDGLREPGVFLNTATGEVKRAERRATGKCWSTRAVDGWLVACEGDPQIASFAADGTSVGAFGAARWPISTRGEGECSDAGVPVWQGAPTLDEAIAYYRDGDESRTLGTLTAADCGHVEYRTPGGGPRPSISRVMIRICGSSSSASSGTRVQGSASGSISPSATAGGSSRSATLCSSMWAAASTWMSRTVLVLRIRSPSKRLDSCSAWMAAVSSPLCRVVEWARVPQSVPCFLWYRGEVPRAVRSGWVVMVVGSVPL